ncbi:Actin/actin-like protein [Rickenella mellea]|uniref:Actin-like protein ARP6 n=1 Tax=Rickenella mellea TaxID=50990 RepID=A0A4Y7PRU8_9AGAM|nr:Actin/actin-like protein [Rickenella mellea]
MTSAPVVVLDNGASTIKASLQHGQSSDDFRIIPNAIVRSKGDRKTYFGHELAQCRDYSSLHYRLPFERGYLTDWDAQKAVWDGVFSSEVLGVNTSESALLITEPPFNLSNIQDVYDQFVFEEYEFQSYFRCTRPSLSTRRFPSANDLDSNLAASLVPHGDLFTGNGGVPPECMLIVDSGFSFTHSIPVMNGVVFWKGVKRPAFIVRRSVHAADHQVRPLRLDVGGKLLTNHLKELVSFRQWNMMDETYIVNDVKESCCYVSNSFKDDLEICQTNPKRNGILREYVLPDFSANRKGRVKQENDILADSDQVLFMNNERFAVPELLFRPSEIGLDQGGIADTIARSIACLPEDLQGMFWANIGLVGGNVKFAGFRERLMSELRSLAPVDCSVHIYESSSPITEAHRAGVEFACSPAFAREAVTRAEYLECGSNACRRKFKDWRSTDREEQKEREREVDRTKHTKPKGKTRANDDETRKKLSRTRTKSTTKRVSRTMA